MQFAENGTIALRRIRSTLPSVDKRDETTHKYMCTLLHTPANMWRVPQAHTCILWYCDTLPSVLTHMAWWQHLLSPLTCTRFQAAQAFEGVLSLSSLRKAVTLQVPSPTSMENVHVWVSHVLTGWCDNFKVGFTTYSWPPLPKYMCIRCWENGSSTGRQLSGSASQCYKRWRNL